MFFLTIVRHGETTSNLGEIIHCRDGGDLTARGILMARSLGKFLKNEVFTRVYSSDFKRTQDTTNLIIEQLSPPTPTPTLEPLLRERGIGEWDMKPYQLVTDKLQQLNLPPYKAHTLEPLNSEPYEDCKLRAGRFLEAMCTLSDATEENNTENVMVVSHSWLISCLFDHILEHPESYQLVNASKEDFQKSPLNTCTTKFAISKRLKSNDAEGQLRSLTFSRVYDVTHLQDLLNC